MDIAQFLPEDAGAFVTKAIRLVERSASSDFKM